MLHARRRAKLQIAAHSHNPHMLLNPQNTHIPKLGEGGIQLRFDFVNFFNRATSGRSTEIWLTSRSGG